MVTCLRCGKCCHYLKNGLIKKCKYLIRINPLVTSCRIYKNRLGKKIDDGVMCSLREKTLFDYSDCPYNTDKEIIF